MAHVKRSMEERRQIERLRLARAPVAWITARLRRHRSTIYREFKRNRFVDDELPELDGCWLRWSPIRGQFRGIATLGSGPHHAAASMTAGPAWASSGVLPPRAECGLWAL